MVAIVDAVGAGAAASWRALRGLPSRRDEMLGALNGLVGDLLEEQDHRLAIPMRLRVEGDVTSRLCVLVHGLMASDDRWVFKSRPGVTYGSLLAEARGVTPVYVTYNSGRHISANGRELAQKLDELVAGWPVPVDEINLIGHSMGGLIARSACHYGIVEGRAWPAEVRRLFLLGAPNRGATVEQLANTVLTGVNAIPLGVAQALGRLVDRRSAGIKDLRHGSLVDEDWQLGRRHPVQLPDGVDVFVGCASVLGGPDHPVGKVLGDVLVTQFSAQARRPRQAGALCDVERTRVFASGHMGLSNNPEVYEQLLAWWC